MSSGGKNIIFLFSLPRSGSTLLQKILTVHSSISSTAEPWILLPFIYATKSNSSQTSIYDSLVASQAISDLIQELPEGKHTYLKALQTFVGTIYEQLSDNRSIYFLDKTPRYYLIIPEIIELFPQAKFIFLFRHPLSVLASYLRTWLDNQLKIDSANIDLFRGPFLLSNGYQLIKEQAFHLRYEDLINDPQTNLKNVLSYLDLTFEPSMIRSFHKIQFNGRYGDPYVEHFDTIQRESLTRWKIIFNSRIRKKYALNYLNNLSDTTLRVSGYDRKLILNELNEVPEHFSVREWFRDKYNLWKYN